MNDDQAALEDFTGVARLFPLPGLVLFPHAVQPLHIFEPRYRDMTAEALDTDRLLALVQLRPGWEDSYDERPDVHPVACLGRIVADLKLPDGRYNLALRGMVRIRILEELPTQKSFRTARVEVIPDILSDDVDELMTLRTALADQLLPRIADSSGREQLSSLFQGELPLGQLCDVLSFALPFAPDVKQSLLETYEVTTRARRLMEAFQGVLDSATSKPLGSGGNRKFPPDFSMN